MEQQLSNKLQITVKAGARPNADIVFSSSSERGGNGPLMKSVLEANNWPDVSPLDLSKFGFAHHRIEKDRLLVVIATVTTKWSTEIALRQGLTNALLSLGGEVQGRSLWIPLMGTGAGELTFAQSAEAIALGFAAFLQVSEARPSNIVIAPPPDLDPRWLWKS